MGNEEERNTKSVWLDDECMRGGGNLRVRVDCELSGEFEVRMR